jgi:hypothetical protein
MKSNTHLLKYLKFYNILKCKLELIKLSKSKNFKERQQLIRKTKDCVINSISELAKNCLYGKIPLKTCDFEKLSKYQNILRKLSSNSSLAKRKNLIIQKGGFLNLLIPAALSFITPIVSEYIKRKINKL